jgi:AcrR family transcriptional regulator
MPTGQTAANDTLRAIRRTAAQLRVIAAARELFAERGVSGTSLQMIADAMGVTKAAVYHQFKTKEEIVLAVTEAQLAHLEEILAGAESSDDPRRARDMLLSWVIDMSISHRGATAALQNDPVIVRLLADHEPFARLIDRMYGVLIGEHAGPEARVPAAVLSAAISSAVLHPLVADLDDTTLRAHLLRLTHRLLDIPDEPPAPSRRPRAAGRRHAGA